MTIANRVVNYLVEQDADYDVIAHPHSSSSLETSQLAHVPGDLIAKSGLVGWIIIGLSIVMLAMVIENFVTLNREKLAPPELIDEIQSLFDEGQFQEAMELCENERNFFTRVCAAGIAKIGHDFEVIETAIQEMGDEEAIDADRTLEDAHEGLVRVNERAARPAEALDALAVRPNGIYIDATFGRGGHSAAMLERLEAVTSRVKAAGWVACGSNGVAHAALK